MKPSRSELLRKLGHVTFGAGAFLVRPLGPGGGAAIALAGLLFNLFLLSRFGGRAIWRRSEAARGFAAGIVLYPLSILVLLLAFWRRPEIAAAVWGIVAFGDGIAALVGGTGIGARLPWNPRKSWVGSAAFVVASTPAAAILLEWTAPGRFDWAFLLIAAALTAVVAAWVESQPQALDDNLTVPILAGVFLYCVLDSARGWHTLLARTTLTGFALGLVVSLTLGAVAYAGRGVTRSGLASGSVLGALIWAAAGWRGFLLLAVFVTVSFASTRVGFRQKEDAGIAQEDGGRRSLRHAVAKLSVPALAILFALATPHAWAFRVAFLGALAAATADTVASEIGQVFGRRTILATSLRPVRRGTEGGISLEGTISGAVAAIFVVIVAAVVGFVSPVEIAPVSLAALVAVFVESLAGATLGARGLLDNEAINFLESLTGAVLAVALVALTSRF